LVAEKCCSIVEFADSLSHFEEEPQSMLTVDEFPRVRHTFWPRYPQALLDTLKGEYYVCTKVWLSATAEIRQVRVMNCPPRELIPYVIGALLQWKFEPGTLDGRPKACWVLFEFSYPTTQTDRDL
jgi:hypothetical protein